MENYSIEQITRKLAQVHAKLIVDMKNLKLHGEMEEATAVWNRAIGVFDTAAAFDISQKTIEEKSREIRRFEF